MRIAVIGEGHLADATRTCCAEHFTVAGNYGALDLVWFCVNTPVNAVTSMPLVDEVRGRLGVACSVVDPKIPILISSPVPVGFCATMEQAFPQHCFVSQPENIRTAHAVEDFRRQDRMIAGMRSMFAPQFTTVHSVLSRFTDNVIFMGPESAEMTKHALNTFLAMEITFANELGEICDVVGADPLAVVKGLKADHRVGDGPLAPGGPPRGSLPRDVAVLRSLSDSPLLSAIGVGV